MIRIIIFLSVGAGASLSASFDRISSLALFFFFFALWLSKGSIYGAELQPFRSGWGFGFGWHLAGLHWLGSVSVLGTFLTSTFAAFGFAIWFWCLSLCKEAFLSRSHFQIMLRALILGVLWFGLEFLRENIFHYPWHGLTVGLAWCPWARAIGSWIGVHGLAGCVIFFTVVVFVYTSRARRLIVLLLVLLSILLSLVLPPSIKNRSSDESNGYPVNFNLVQTSSESPISKFLSAEDTTAIQLVSLAEKLKKNSLAEFCITLIPESAFFTNEGEVPNPVAVSLAHSAGSNVVLYGCDENTKSGVRRKIIAATRRSINEIHQKHHLIPFAESLPFGLTPSAFQWTGQSEFLSVCERSPTPPHPVAVSDEVTIIPLLCYEDTFQITSPPPDHSASHGCLVSLGDHRIFDNPAVAQAHFLNSQWRTVETGWPIVYCFRGGFSGYVLASGIKGGGLPLLKPDLTSFVLNLPISSTTTFFWRHSQQIKFAGYSAVPFSLILLWVLRRRDARK